MKKSILSIALLILSLVSIQGQSIVIHLKDGTVTKIATSNIIKITTEEAPEPSTEGHIKGT